MSTAASSAERNPRNDEDDAQAVVVVDFATHAQPRVPDAEVQTAQGRLSFNGLRHRTTSHSMQNAHAAATIIWKDLSIKVKRGTKVLLNKVCGVIDPGFWAVMGPSGSGKTTLLNALAYRLDKNVKVSGERRLNGHKYDSSYLKKVGGYVMQDDLLNGNLTVDETLLYAAELRLPPFYAKEQREKRVEEVVKQMGLMHTRQTVVGTPLKKGISGGERKRLCVAIELLTHPTLLFLDEPTSGLDSVAALSLCQQLKELSDNGLCTIVCTIHQPQSKIFNLFDHLILLKSGDIVYHGAAASVLDTYAAAGFPCPERTNPADHVMDVITPALSENRDGGVAADNVLKLKEQYNGDAVEVPHPVGEPLITERQRVPWWRQFLVLLRRCIIEQVRRWDHMATLLLQTLIMAVLIGTVFLDIGNSQSSVSRRQPVLFFAVINQGMFGALLVINSFPSERMLVLRERAAGTYYVSAYYVAKMAAETIFQLPVPILFSCVVYWLVGFQAVAAKFFIFMCFMILCSLAATSLALMVSAWCRTTDLSVIVLPMALEVSRLFGGFFLSPKNLPTYFVWLDAISYVKWSYIGISLNELGGLTLYCTEQQLAASPNGECPVTSGQQTIDQLGMDKYTIGMCVGILWAFIVVCRFVAYLGIRFIKW